MWVLSMKRKVVCERGTGYRSLSVRGSEEVVCENVCTLVILFVYRL